LKESNEYGKGHLGPKRTNPFISFLFSFLERSILFAIRTYYLSLRIKFENFEFLFGIKDLKSI